MLYRFETVLFLCFAVHYFQSGNKNKGIFVYIIHKYTLLAEKGEKLQYIRFKA